MDPKHQASMRPPEFTGGNCPASVELAARGEAASMRPPEFTGGNALRHAHEEVDGLVLLQ